METLEAIYKRRAVKHFDPNHKMSKEEEEKILEAANPLHLNKQK